MSPGSSSSSCRCARARRTARARARSTPSSRRPSPAGTARSGTSSLGRSWCVPLLFALVLGPAGCGEGSLSLFAAPGGRSLRTRQLLILCRGPLFAAEEDLRPAEYVRRERRGRPQRVPAQPRWRDSELHRAKPVKCTHGVDGGDSS